jgi:hypothetical protein
MGISEILAFDKTTEKDKRILQSTTYKNLLTFNISLKV